jgi:hypothetical protein
MGSFFSFFRSFVPSFFWIRFLVPSQDTWGSSFAGQYQVRKNEKTKERKGEAFISYRPVIVKLDGKVDSHDAPVP